jgi:hypothetical protein
MNAQEFGRIKAGYEMPLKRDYSGLWTLTYNKQPIISNVAYGIAMARKKVLMKQESYRLGVFELNKVK